MPYDSIERPNYQLPARRADLAGRSHRGTIRSIQGASEENAISHTFLLWVLRQWWMIVMPVGLVLAMIAGGIVVYFYTPEYEATALLMIEQNSPYIAFSEPGAATRGVDRYVQTQLELLRSAVVLEPTLGRPAVAAIPELAGQEDRVKYLRDRLSIKQIGQSELYNVSFTSTSAEMAAKVVNAVVAQYMEVHLSYEDLRTQRVIEILEQEGGRRQLEVDHLRQRVVKLAKDVTGKDPFGTETVTDVDRALSPVGALFQSMTEAEMEGEMLEAQLKSLGEASVLLEQRVQASGLLDYEIEQHADIRERRKTIADIDTKMELIKLDEIRVKTDPQWETNQNYVALKNTRAELEKDLVEAKTKARETMLAQRREQRKAEIEQEVEKLQNDQKTLEARKAYLSAEFAKQVEELQSGGAKSVELVFARDELAREEQVLDMIVQRKLALQTELRAPARVQLTKEASPPKVAIEPIPYKFLLLGCCSAFVAPLGLAVLREMTVRRISDVDQLARESGVRVLGEVAALPVRYVATSPRQLSGKLRRDTYIYAESINSLRTNLAVAEGLSGQQVIVVTSAAPAEGKTSVAVSLAMSISGASDEPTLIIDGDMRSPAVASMLKVKNQPGLFEVLSKKCKLDDVIQQAGHNNLFVIPGGRATKSTHSVVGVTEIRELLDQLRPRFSTIVIDTPPILGASESLLLAKAADSVLFCSLCDVSKAKQVRIAVDRLEHANANVAGAVLSGTPAKRYEYVYGYYANRSEAAG